MVMELLRKHQILTWVEQREFLLLVYGKFRTYELAFISFRYPANFHKVKASKYFNQEELSFR